MPVFGVFDALFKSRPSQADTLSTDMKSGPVGRKPAIWGSLEYSLMSSMVVSGMAISSIV